jgi:hypothetical protein
MWAVVENILLLSFSTHNFMFHRHHVSFPLFSFTVGGPSLTSRCYIIIYISIEVILEVPIHSLWQICGQLRTWYPLTPSMVTSFANIVWWEHLLCITMFF